MTLKYTRFKTALVFLILLAALSAAQSSIPALEKIKEYNLSYSQSFLLKVSVPLAFIAGLISFISPCVLPVLPVYFAGVAQQKKKVFKMTLLFFLGLSITFTLMGVAAAYAGGTIISMQYDYRKLIMAAGLVLIAFGVMSFFGRGFSFLHGRLGSKAGGAGGIFLTGVLFGVGWTPCLGPILSGILLMASVLQNYVYAALLLFSYSLGIGLPLFVMSMLYDKYDLSKNRFIRGRELDVRIGGKTIRLHSTRVLSGLLLIAVGLLFILDGGTFIVNSWDPFGTRMFVSIKQKALLGL